MNLNDISYFEKRREIPKVVKPMLTKIREEIPKKVDNKSNSFINVLKSKKFTRGSIYIATLAITSVSSYFLFDTFLQRPAPIFPPNIPPFPQYPPLIPYQSPSSPSPYNPPNPSNPSPPLLPPSPPVAPPPQICNNNCIISYIDQQNILQTFNATSNNICNDGGGGSGSFFTCDFGNDCDDCNVRENAPPSPPYGAFWSFVDGLNCPVTITSNSSLGINDNCIETVLQNGRYTAGSNCNITILEDMSVVIIYLHGNGINEVFGQESTQFSILTCKDYLEIEGNRFCLHDVNDETSIDLVRNSQIKWVTDSESQSTYTTHEGNQYTVQDGIGFKLCVQTFFPPRPPPPSVPPITVPPSPLLPFPNSPPNPPEHPSPIFLPSPPPSPLFPGISSEICSTTFCFYQDNLLPCTSFSSYGNNSYCNTIPEECSICLERCCIQGPSAPPPPPLPSSYCDMPVGGTTPEGNCNVSDTSLCVGTCVVPSGREIMECTNNRVLFYNNAFDCKPLNTLNSTFTENVYGSIIGVFGSYTYNQQDMNGVTFSFGTYTNAICLCAIPIGSTMNNLDFIGNFYNVTYNVPPPPPLIPPPQTFSQYPNGVYELAQNIACNNLRSWIYSNIVDCVNQLDNSNFVVYLFGYCYVYERPCSTTTISNSRLFGLKDDSSTSFDPFTITSDTLYCSINTTNQDSCSIILQQGSTVTS